MEVADGLSAELSFSCRLLSGRPVSCSLPQSAAIADAKTSISSLLGCRPRDVLLMADGRALADSEQASSVKDQIVLFLQSPLDPRMVRSPASPAPSRPSPRPPRSALSPARPAQSDDCDLPSDYRWRIECVWKAAPSAAEEEVERALRQCMWDFVKAPRMLGDLSRTPPRPDSPPNRAARPPLSPRGSRGTGPVPWKSG
jgi:hypothetical protein